MGQNKSPIPASVFSIVGPVTIAFVADLRTQQGEHAFGLWCPDERTIKLNPATHPTTQLVTLFHEMVHVALWDAGANIPEEIEERVADALSTYLYGAGAIPTGPGQPVPRAASHPTSRTR